MKPRFISKVMKNGEVVKEFPPEVIKPQICKEKTVKLMQVIQEHVVSHGLRRKAGSKSFKVAGKTGTAQVSQGAGGYKTGVTNYLLSFAGYFPADNPRYSCIVCIQKSGLPASGGGMSGVVFHHIAEGIMARHLKLSVEDAKDSASVFIPDVKNGNILAANYVLEHLGVKTERQWSGSYVTGGNPVWGKAQRKTSDVELTKMKTYSNIVPDVTGMGASDAVYMLESRGLKTVIKGRGKVKSQSLHAGSVIKKGQTCEIIME